MDETSVDVVMDGYRKALETAASAGVPLVAVTASGGLASAIRSQDLGCAVVELRRIVEPPFAVSQERRTVGPLFVVN
jgi:hypothetical protein